MNITANMVKELREKTGAGMMDCKKMLVQADGDIEKAIDLLREKGLASAAKKADRIASQGVVDSYIHMGGKIGVLVEVNCETDFVAKTDEFKALCHDIAMQIAAAKPLYVNREEVPEDVLEHEKEIARQQAINEGRPEKIIDSKIVPGRIEKYYKEFCLVDQDFVKDPEKTISDLVKEKIAKIGENIQIRRFVRFEMGEGLEKRVDTALDEIAASMEAMNKAKA